mmetsp:Transcript_223/g.454  ORF Transcript_223/g.454 Transcript_223/m.454 type:complete len:741 (+) Transcript_223:139-2361(+)
MINLHAAFAKLGRNDSRGKLTSASGRRPRLLHESDSKVFSKGRSYWSPVDWLLGTGAGQIVVFFVMAFGLVAGGTVGWKYWAGPSEEIGNSFEEARWLSWGLFIDPGTQTGFNGTDNYRVKIFVATLSVLGFVYNLALLGLVVDAIRGTLSAMKLEHSRVVANGHTLVLGWGDKSLFLLDQLMRAYGENATRKRVVILADMPEDELAANLRDLFGDNKQAMKKISIRQGDPIDGKQLSKVSVHSADDVIILGPSGVTDESSDHRVLQIILALAALPGKLQVTGEVFAEMRNEDNVDVVKALLPCAEGIAARTTVFRMLCICALEPALGRCLVEMATFTIGNELYLVTCPAKLVGFTFAEACGCFPDAALLGLRPQKTQGLAVPQASYKLRETDSLVFSAQSIAAMKNIKTSADGRGASPQVEAAFTKMKLDWSEPVRKDKKTIIMLGAPQNFPELLGVLNEHVGSGSKVHMLSEREIAWREQRIHSSAIDSDDSRDWANISLHHHVGAPTFKGQLAKLDLAHADSILILSEARGGEGNTESALAMDSRSLNIAVILDQVVHPKGRKESILKEACEVVCVLNDMRAIAVTQDSALSAKSFLPPGFYFHQNLLETAIFAMAAEDTSVFNMLTTIVQPDGGKTIIKMVPASQICVKQEDLSFWQLHSRVLAATGCSLFGWQRHGGLPVMNPPNKDQVLDWAPMGDDKLLVACALGSGEFADNSGNVSGPSATNEKQPLLGTSR